MECDQLLFEFDACWCDGQLFISNFAQRVFIPFERLDWWYNCLFGDFYFLVQTLGNHEFDNYIDGITPFLDVIKTPIVLANVDTADEPDMQGKFQNFTILERGGRRIGVIGVLTRDTQVRHDNYVWIPKLGRIFDEN